MLLKLILLSLLIFGINGLYKDEEVFHCDEDVSDE